MQMTRQISTGENLSSQDLVSSRYRVEILLRQALKVTLVQLDLLALKALKALKALRALREFKVILDLLVQLVPLV
jgi:hypothetical protein